MKSIPPSRRRRAALTTAALPISSYLGDEFNCVRIVEETSIDGSNRGNRFGNLKLRNQFLGFKAIPQRISEILLTLEHYKDLSVKSFFPGLINYITSGRTSRNLLSHKSFLVHLQESKGCFQLCRAICSSHSFLYADNLGWVMASNHIPFDLDSDELDQRIKDRIKGGNRYLDGKTFLSATTSSRAVRTLNVIHGSDSPENGKREIAYREEAAIKELLTDTKDTRAEEEHIEMLSSDHSPSVPELKLLKEGNFLKAWGDISSMQDDMYLELMKRNRELGEQVVKLSDSSHEMKRLAKSLSCIL